MFSCELFFADANIAVCFVKSDALPVVFTRQIVTWRLQNENKIILIYFIYLFILVFLHFIIFLTFPYWSYSNYRKKKNTAITNKYKLSLQKFPLLDAHARTHAHPHIPAFCDLRRPSWEPTLPGPAEIRMLSEQRYVCLHTWQ